MVYAVVIESRISGKRVPFFGEAVHALLPHLKSLQGNHRVSDAYLQEHVGRILQETGVMEHMGYAPRERELVVQAWRHVMRVVRGAHQVWIEEFAPNGTQPDLLWRRGQLMTVTEIKTGQVDEPRFWSDGYVKKALRQTQGAAGAWRVQPPKGLSSRTALAWTAEVLAIDDRVQGNAGMTRIPVLAADGVAVPFPRWQRPDGCGEVVRR